MSAWTPIHLTGRGRRIMKLGIRESEIIKENGGRRKIKIM
jgi:hypothetical protein